VLCMRSKAMKALVPWPAFAERHWRDIPNAPGLGCFGTGFDGWGVQTNQKYLGACAALAADPDFDAGACGMDRERLFERALSALRYSLATHKSGSRPRTDGSQWGCTWISGLGIERMMHGIEALEPRLTERDREGLRRVLVSEAETQLRAEVVAGLWGDSGRNKPESNIWNGAILARAALMYPDHPHAGEWRRKADVFLLNGISVPADAADPALGDRHVGANFFPHYALDHHAYLNVGYMVICLSNVAMLHYGFRARGTDAPASLYHHAADLWALVRRLVFANGRLLRIGGDTRQRYCYCQDYLLPALVWAADHLRDPHALMLAEGALDTIAVEQGHNGDGSFVGRRLGHIARTNPYYYTRLESDKAVVLSMTAQWVRRFGIRAPAPDVSFEESVRGGWEEREHGAAFHRCPTRIVSWSWRAAERPQGLCLPPDGAHMAEWEENLAGRVAPAGVSGRRRVLWQWVRSFDGGFLTMGRVNEGADVYLAEGYRASDLIDHRIAFAALPDGHTAVRLERAAIGGVRVYLRRVEGVSLRIANDLFNGMSRTYYHAGGEHVSAPPRGDDRVDFRSAWVNVEDRLGLVGVYGAPGWSLVREAERSGGHAGSIFSDRLCYPARAEMHDVFGPADVLDTGCLIVASVDRAATEALSGRAAGRLACAEDHGRAVLVEGRDGCRYLLAVNFSSSLMGVTPDLSGPAELVDLCTGSRVSADGEGGSRLPVAPQAAALYRVAVYGKDGR